MLLSCTGLFFFSTFSATVGVCVFKFLMVFFFFFPCSGDTACICFHHRHVLGMSQRCTARPAFRIASCLQIHKPRLSRLLFRDAFVCSACNQVRRPPRALFCWVFFFFLCCVNPKRQKRGKQDRVGLTRSSSVLVVELQVQVSTPGVRRWSERPGQRARVFCQGEGTK